MKNIFTFLCVVLILITGIYPEEIIKLKNETDYLEKLVENGIYFKHIQDADYDNGALYLLDISLGNVIVVDFKTGKLIKTLFRRGQGPNELMLPRSIKVKNNKVFVYDEGFNGIKIADLQGNLIKEFKIRGIVGMRNIDVNDRDEIFVGEYNSQTKTYISVYDINGANKRWFIQIDPKANDKLPLERIHYKFKVDDEGNILILFNVLKELKKFSAKGELIWERIIKNEMLGMIKQKAKVEFTKKGAMHTSMFVFNLEITPDKNVLVGSVGGVNIYDSGGKLLKVITPEPPNNFIYIFKIIGNELLDISPAGKIIKTFDIKEEIK